MTIARRHIEQRLPKVRNEIDALRAKLDAKYAEQLTLWQAGSSLDVPMLHRELAEMSGVRPSTVSVALAKAAKQVTRRP